MVLVSRVLYFADKSVNWMNWSVYLVDRSLYLANKSLYLAARSEFLVTTSSIFLSSAWICDWTKFGSFSKILFSAIACARNTINKIQTTIVLTYYRSCYVLYSSHGEQVLRYTGKPLQWYSFKIHVFRKSKFLLRDTELIDYNEENRILVYFVDFKQIRFHNLK